MKTAVDHRRDRGFRLTSNLPRLCFRYGLGFRYALLGVLLAGLGFVPVHIAMAASATIAKAAQAGTSASATAKSSASSPPRGMSSTAYPQRKGEPKLQQSASKSESNSPEGIDELQYLRSPMVQTLARWLGLSVETTSRMFELINFALLVIGIVWLVAKRLPKALRQRKQRLRMDLEQAHAAIESANRRLAAVEERLSRLDSEIEAIRTQAEQETKIEEQRLRAAMEQEKQSILHMASEDIHAATRNMQNQMRRLAADLTIEHAARQISITAEIDRSLVHGFLRDLGGKSPQAREDA